VNRARGRHSTQPCCRSGLGSPRPTPSGHSCCLVCLTQLHVQTPFVPMMPLYVSTQVLFLASKLK
jgi:hypothetical protein